MVINVLLVMAFGLFVLRPYSLKARDAAQRIAGLLSHVPPEAVDVRARVRAAIKRGDAIDAQGKRE